jgi:SAM-dependent methyltransferase
MSLSVDKKTKSMMWDNWPIWESESNFRTPNFNFRCSVSDYSSKTDAGRISILKHKQFLEIYKKLSLAQDINSVLELGFFQGGMPLFLADVVQPEKILAIDWNHPTKELSALLARTKIKTKIELVGGIDQGNAVSIRKLVKRAFGSEPLDLIIDDCSHYYPQTKICFENLFGYLKPGGKYIVEDWGWTHWPGSNWQGPASHFHDMPSMSNMIFEFVMALASKEDMISSIEIPSSYCCIVTRGPALAHGEVMSLKDVINVAGGREAKLITAAPGSKTLAPERGFLKKVLSRITR